MSPVPQPLQPGDFDPQAETRGSDGPDLLTQVQVCARLGISDETWRRWRRALRTPEPVTMPSGRLKWRASDIEALSGRPLKTAGPRRYFASVYRRAQQPVAVVRHGARSVGQTPTHRKGVA